jgi:hypothetical protein
MLSGSHIVYVNVTWCFSCDVIKFTDCLCKCYMAFYLVVMLSGSHIVYAYVTWCLVVMLYTYQFVYVNMLHGVLVVMLSSSHIVYVNVTW